MKQKVKSINIYELQPSMMLAEDLILNGLTLVTKKVALNNLIIEKILEFYPSNTISICSYEEKEAPSSSQNLRAQSIIQTEVLLNNFSKKIDKFLKTIKKDTKPDLTEIRNMTKEILDDISDYGAIIKTLTNSRNIDERLTRHCVNVALLSSMLGRWLDLPTKDLTLLTYASFLHDIGKTMVNPTILNKTSKLTKLELEEIKKHSIYSYELVRNIPFLDESVSFGVLMHHERLDGSGYPLHLKDDKINSFAKIIGITDTFDDMTAGGAYVKKQNPLKVLDVLQHDCIGLLDYSYINTFIKHMSNYYTGETVKLNNGSIGKIIKIDLNNISRPLLSIDSNFIDLSVEKELSIIEVLP